MPILIVLVFAFAAAGTHDHELTALAEMARTAPPDIGAATLLRVAAAVQAKDPAWAAELYANAFELAAAAPDALPKRALVNNGPAYSFKIDRLSLQVAAVRGLLGREPRRARDLFTRMVRPAVAAAKCDDSLVDDPAAYYALVADIANSTYSGKERAREDHLAAAHVAIQSITSPGEIAPAVHMVRALRLTAPQLDSLTAKLGAALERVAGDDRAFSATLRDVDSAVGEIPVLRLELADYKARNQNNEHCDTDQMATNTISGGAAEQAKSKDPVIEQWRRDFLALAFGSGKGALSDAEKKTGEWRDRMNDLLRRVEDWRPVDGRSEAEIAGAKADVLAGAAWITPPGPDRTRVLDRLVVYLSQSSDDRSAWFARVDGLLRLTRGTHPEEERNVLAAYERSGNPVLVLYAQLERLLPSATVSR